MYNSDMTSFYKRAFKIMLPIIASQVLIVAVGFVDNFMIADYDVKQNHLTAVGAGAEIWFAMSSFYFAIGALFSIFYAQFHEKHDTTHFKDTFKFNLHIALIFMIVISLIMYFVSDELTSLFFLGDGDGVDSTARKLSGDYLKILSLGNIFASLSYFLINPLVIMGKAKYLLILSVISLVTNILFDYMFIYVIDKGSSGAAWSTSLSFGVQFLVSIFFFWLHRDKFSGTWNVFKIDKGVLNLVSRRLWMIFTITFFNVSLVAITIIWSNMYGSELMKSMSIAYAISSIAFTVFPAIGQSAKILIGSELGKSNFDEAKVVAKKLFIAILCVTTVLSVLGIISAFTLPNAFIHEAYYQDMSKWMILAFSTILFVFVITTYFSSVLETGGNQLAPTILNYSSQLLLVIPAQIIAGPWVLDLPFEIAFFISQSVMIIPAFISFVIYKRNKWLINFNESKHLVKKNS